MKIRGVAKNDRDTIGFEKTATTFSNIMVTKEAPSRGNNTAGASCLAISNANLNKSSYEIHNPLL